MFGLLARWFHMHAWVPSLFSASGAYTVEERCDCGAFRHCPDAYHYMCGEWIAGPHPTGVALRAAEADARTVRHPEVP